MQPLSPSLLRLRLITSPGSAAAICIRGSWLMRRRTTRAAPTPVSGSPRHHRHLGLRTSFTARGARGVCQSGPAVLWQSQTGRVWANTTQNWPGGGEPASSVREITLPLLPHWLCIGCTPKPLSIPFHSLPINQPTWIFQCLPVDWFYRSNKHTCYPAICRVMAAPLDVQTETPPWTPLGRPHYHPHQYP